MELIRGLHNLRPLHRNCVATIGNFDGVHLGHRKILSRAKVLSQALAVPAVAIIFEPQPQEFFAKEHAPARLTRFREKILAMQSCDIDRILCLVFNEHFASLTAEQFIQNILLDGLNIQHLIVGDDFHFGKQRQGNFSLLEQAGKQYGFAVERTSTFSIDTQRVSSTRIRDALFAAHFPLAKKLLGRDFSLSGKVEHGHQRGRTIGFPTANVALKRNRSPLQGVFAVAVYFQGQRYNAVANIGKRPTVDGTRQLLEVHLLDFSANLYQQHLEVIFLHKLRDEQKFENFSALQAQIQCDIADAKQFFEQNK